MSSKKIIRLSVIFLVAVIIVGVLSHKLANQQITVAVIGDSIANGTGATDNLGEVEIAKQSLPNVIFTNYSVNGLAIADSIFDKQVDNAIKDNPKLDIAYISIGTNDIRKPNFTSPPVYKEKLERAISKFNDNGTIVVLQTQQYVDNMYNIWEGKDINLTLAYNQIIRSEANTKVFVDDNNSFDYFKSNPSLLSDGVHPNSLGHQYLGQRMSETLEKVLLGRRVYFYFRG